jgi:hypothetical protein
LGQGESADTAVNKYIALLNSGNLKNAYDALSAPRKSKQDFASFQKAQNANLVYEVKTLCTDKKGDNAAEVRATVMTAGKDGKNRKTTDIKFYVIKEGTAWKIDSY